MPAHNLQAHEVSCLIQAIDDRKNPTDFNFFKKSHEQAKPILAAIVKEIETSGKVDEVIKEVCDTWTKFNYEDEVKEVKRMFKDNGEKLLDIFQDGGECAHYLILSALLNSKKKKEDIKLFTYESVAAHIAAKETMKDHQQCAFREIIVVLKFLLEQDLIMTAIALETGAGETQLRDFQPQKVEVVKSVMQVLKARVEQIEGRTLTLLNAARTLKASNMFAEFAKAEESHGANSYRWIIGGFGILTVICVLLGLFFGIYSF